MLPVKPPLLEILTEEKSMAVFLEGVLSRILPGGWKQGLHYEIRPHEGKSHLRKSLPKKMRAYAYFPRPVKVLVIHDQDSNDCRQLKNDLQNLCEQNSDNVPFVIRIVCRELENWYLGDFNAISKVYEDEAVLKQQNKAKYRDADRTHGSSEMKKLVKNFEKMEAAARMSQYMDIHKNRSTSFQHFVSGIQKVISV